MINPEGSDFKLWHWAALGIWTFITGLVGGTWAVKGRYDDLKNSVEAHGKKLVKIEEMSDSITEIQSDVAYIKGVIDEHCRTK